MKEMHVVEGKVERAVLNGLRLSSNLRTVGKAEEVVVKEGKKVLLTILPQGDIEEPLRAPLTVSVGERVAHDVTNGADGVVVKELTPRQKNAISLARLIVGIR